MRFDEGLMARVDEARGDVSRTRFVERALEAAVASLGPDPAVEQLRRAGVEPSRYSGSGVGAVFVAGSRLRKCPNCFREGPAGDNCKHCGAFIQ